MRDTSIGWLLTLGTLLAGPVAATTSVTLFADLRTEGSDVFDPLPNFATVGELAFFSAADDHHGEELWVSDGTPEGTRRITDICPGSCDTAPGPLVAGDDRLFFLATDDVWGRDLWVSDGTPEGTHSLRKGEARGAILLGFTGGKLYFQVDDPALGWEPWVSDGTPAGTHLLRDVCPGGCDSLPSPPCMNGCPFEPAPSIGHHGAFFLVADDGVHGRELWVSDGTESGTSLVADLCAGSCSSDPNAFALFQDTIYFVADDGVRGRELWVSDGTAAGTALFAELRPGPQDFALGRIVPLDDRFFYAFGSGCSPPSAPCVWKSDGTPAGTRLTTELFPDGLGHLSFAREVVVAGSNLFWLERFEESTQGLLWGSAGDADSRRQLIDAHNLSVLAALPDGRVFLHADEGDASPAELWVSDGTTAGTQRIAAVNPAFSHDPTRSSAAVLGDQIVFVTGAHLEPRSLWVSDGSAAGTHKLADLSAASTSSNPQRLTSRGDQLFFNAASVNTFPLWASDGTAAGTTILSEQLRPQHWIARGDQLVFNTGTHQGGVLGVTDGTAAGTLRFTADFDVRGAMAVLGEQVFFAAGANGQQLWASDGTEAGTRLIRTVSGASGPYLELPGALTPLGSKLLFIAFDGLETPQLWRSDGTQGGTIPIKTFSPCQGCLEPTAAPHDLTVLGEQVLFAAFDPASGWELWASDGTGTGTVGIKDLVPGPDSSFPSNFAVLSGEVFFSVRRADGHEELWLSDGTAAGTRSVADLSLGGEPSRVAAMVSSGPRLFLTVFNPTTGTELWTSDGTAAGTRMVRDLWPGPAEALPNALLPLGEGRVVFSANDGRSGFELWVSDGTAEGTLRIDDLAPGFASSAPSEPTRVGDRITFVADDGVHDREVFAVKLADLPSAPPPPPPCAQDRLCLHAGRFEVGVTWRDFQGNTGPGRVVPGLDSDDSGLFWFFDPANYEFLVKVLDGCGFNGHYWVLAAATTNVEYTLTVTDTTTGVAAIYSNALGRSSPAIIDVEAFDDCP